MTAPASLDEVMIRTMRNYQYVKGHATNDGPFEVTQLVNSFLCGLIQPCEGIAMNQPPWNLPLANAEVDGWPPVTHPASNFQPATLGELVREMRNALSHGLVQFEKTDTNDINDITGLMLETKTRESHHIETRWNGTLLIPQLEQFLIRFVELASQH